MNDNSGSRGSVTSECPVCGRSPLQALVYGDRFECLTCGADLSRD